MATSRHLITPGFLIRPTTQSQTLIPIGIGLETTRTLSQHSEAPQTEDQSLRNVSIESDYDLQIITTKSQTQGTTTAHHIDTSTQVNRGGSTRTQEVVTSHQGIPLPPPKYDFVTSRVPDTDLRKHLDTLVHENIPLREENEKRLEAIQKETAMQIATLTQTVNRLTENLQTATNPVTRSTGHRNVLSLEGVTLSEPHLPTPSIRKFTEAEQLQGTKNFREWAASVHTELQLHEIAETLMSDGAIEAPWPLSTQLRADAVARRIILQSVSPKIRPDLHICPSTFHMWKLLNRRYRIINLYSSHQLMTEIESMTILPNQTAVEFISDIQRLRDEYASVAQDHSESYWTSAVLCKLQTRYKTETKELMRHPEYTVEDIRTYFAEKVYKNPTPSTTHRTHAVSRRYSNIAHFTASASMSPYSMAFGMTSQPTPTPQFLPYTPTFPVQTSAATSTTALKPSVQSSNLPTSSAATQQKTQQPT